MDGYLATHTERLSARSVPRVVIVPDVHTFLTRPARGATECHRFARANTCKLISHIHHPYHKCNRDSLALNHRYCFGPIDTVLILYRMKIKCVMIFYNKLTTLKFVPLGTRVWSNIKSPSYQYAKVFPLAWNCTSWHMDRLQTQKYHY